MKKGDLIQKIIIGVLAASTISVSVAMGIMLNAAYVTVTLRAGEGSFENNQQNIILQNVKPGSSLKTISGYVLPSKNNEDYTFDNWIDDEDHKIVEQDAPINRNTILVASYTYSTKYYQKEYISNLESQTKDITDFTADWQVLRGYPFCDKIQDVFNNAITTLSGDITSKIELDSIYQFASTVLGTIDRISWWINSDVCDVHVPPERLTKKIDGLINIYKYISPHFGNDYTDEQWKALAAISNSLIYTYECVDNSFNTKAYEKYFNELSAASNSSDLRIIETIGAGVVRATEFVSTDKEFNDLQQLANNILENLKNRINQPDQLSALLELAGYYLVINYRSDQRAVREEFYNNAIAWFLENQFVSQQKYEITLNYFKNLCGDVRTDIGFDEVKEFVTKKMDNLTTQQILDVKELINRATNILHHEGRYINDVGDNSFGELLFTNIIDNYTKAGSKLSFNFCLNIVKTMENIVPRDTSEIKNCSSQNPITPFVAQYKYFLRLFYLNISEGIMNPVDIAITIYTDHIDDIPNDYIPAFERLVQGIVDSTIYGFNNVKYFIDHTSYGIEWYLNALKEADSVNRANAIAELAYNVCLGQPIAYSHKYTEVRQAYKDDIIKRGWDWLVYTVTRENEQVVEGYAKVVGALLSNGMSKRFCPFESSGQSEEAYTAADTLFTTFTNYLNDIKNTPFVGYEKFNRVADMLADFLNTNRWYYFETYQKWAESVANANKFLDEIKGIMNAHVKPNIHNDEKFNKIIDTIINEYSHKIARTNNLQNPSEACDLIIENIEAKLKAI